MTINLTRRQALAGGLASSAIALGGRRARAQSTPIQIGVLQTLSGSLGVVGQSHLLGARIAVDQVNASGGIDGRKIELVVRDVKANANDAVAAMHELAGLGINLVVGDAFTPPNLAVFPLAAQLNSVYMAPTVIAMELTHELFNKNCFRAGANAAMTYRGQTRTIQRNHPNIKRFGSLVADAAGFRTAHAFLYAGLKKAYGDAGTPVELIEPVMAKVGSADYRAQCYLLLEQKIDGLIIADTGTEFVTFIKQARALGVFKDIKAVGDMTYSTSTGPALRKEIPQDMYSLCTWARDAYKQYPMAEAMYKVASAETKLAFIDPFIPQAHTATLSLIEGVRRAKSTKSEDVIKSIESMTFDTVYGPLSYRPEDHQLLLDTAFTRLGPADTEEGWQIKDFIRIPWKDTIEPPTPGVKFELT